VRADPNFANAHYNLGNLLVRLGRTDDAVASYRRAVESRPDFAEARHNLAYILAAERRRDEALAEYSKALRFATEQNKQALIEAIRVHIRECEAAKFKGEGIALPQSVPP
jgi:tetratricopeptide (TPR) repeat protein